MPAPAPEMIRSSDGVDLAVHDLGGDGPVVLLAHATGFHGLVWSPLAAALSDAYHCVAVDFRGHGDSTVPDHGSFDWAGFADDVEAVIDHLGHPNQLWAIGHSKGGAALLLAEQRAPGTFAGLYLFEPIVLGPEARQASAAGLREHPLATGARKRREVFDSRDDAYRNYAAKPPLDALDPRALEAYVDHGFLELDDGTVRLKCRGENEAQVYSMSTSHTAFDHLDEVHCPVVIAAGSPTEAGPASFAQPIAAALPHGSFEQHPELGHFGPLEAPEAIASRAREAFSR